MIDAICCRKSLHGKRDLPDEDGGALQRSDRRMTEYIRGLPLEFSVHDIVAVRVVGPGESRRTNTMTTRNADWTRVRMIVAG